LNSYYYARKLYAFLRSIDISHGEIQGWGLTCLKEHLDEEHLDGLKKWWDSHGELIRAIASSSDRVNLNATTNNSTEQIPIRHPISGEHGTVHELPAHPTIQEDRKEDLKKESDARKVFWWFWRFYPELWLNPQNTDFSDGLLYPAHRVLPDCPIHSYQATVSALTGAMFPSDWKEGDEASRPYLLIFTFSPIQDFIKASRKFLDFWAGSYLLHYLSARLCWHIADVYGPDAIIVPSLWGQDIVDAFLVKTYSNDSSFAEQLKHSFKSIGDQKTPVERFSDRSSTSLSTAGFPNVITALVPGQEKAKELGQALTDKLRSEWMAIGEKVRNDIRDRVSQEAADILNSDSRWNEFWAEVKEGLPNTEPEAPYRSDLEKWRSQHNQHHQPIYPSWEWCKLWKAQLENSWEPYWAAVPLGDPNQLLEVSRNDDKFDDAWKAAQHKLSQAWIKIPSDAEEHAFDTLNVGSWWGSFQQRLRIAIQAVKNTRTWNIPVAPGERSTISGQYTAVHPNLNYGVVKRQRDGREQDLDFREGAGVPEGSMRLFWMLVSKVYPGLFSGSEHLNALELTKRMGWIYGDVAESLGINVSRVTKRIQRHKKLLGKAQQSWEVQHLERFLYDRFVRFPNLSSIAAARFICDNPDVVQNYCVDLERAIATELGSKYQRIFGRIVRVRPGHIPQTDQRINSSQQKRKYLNGVMFSAKWLAEDMGLELPQAQTLRGITERVHKDNHFGEGSPSDWWAVVLADGDSMGQYISGTKLETYQQYIDKSAIEQNTPGLDELYAEKKRMGPATHIGLNRALLDFSNRLVPYLTEKRFCGKVIYSGGDDVMAVLPLEDLPSYLRSLRAAWSGKNDPYEEFDHGDGYWRPKPEKNLEGVPQRPLFTMGGTATMSMGVVIAYKTVPLPTVLENLWVAEGDRAKEMYEKDGICFRVIYGGGNTLEALMKGHLLDAWWDIVQQYADELSPLLYRLADELPKRVDVAYPELFPLAAQVIMNRRDSDRKIAGIEEPIKAWLAAWAEWAKTASEIEPDQPGATSNDLGYLLRFTAFWVDKMVQRQKWTQAANSTYLSEEPTTIGR
jgi:CRISPR-associated protein Cmr2